MAKPSPDQALNLAGAPSPDGQPSPHAQVIRARSSEPAPGDEHDDLSMEKPTNAATVKRESEAEVSLALRVLRLIDLRMDGRGSTISAASAYLLIVLAGACAAYVIGQISPIDGNPIICGLVFLVVLFAGLLSHKKLR